MTTPDDNEKTNRRRKTRTPGKSINEDSGKENMAYEDEDEVCQLIKLALLSELVKFDS